MKTLTIDKAREIKAGKGHYHWVCKHRFNFKSKPYTSYAKAAVGADKHIVNYPAHADRTSVIYCESKKCK